MYNQSQVYVDIYNLYCLVIIKQMLQNLQIVVSISNKVVQLLPKQTIMKKIFTLCLIAFLGATTVNAQIPGCYKTIAPGTYHTLAIKNDGSLWAWGYNYYGQLGDGTNTNRNTPVQIGTATNWASISAGFYYSLAIKNDGTLWAWGYNTFGQLGIGNTTNQLSPVQVGTANNWASVSAGYQHSLAIKTDGTLWAWGYNNGGQLGDGTYTSRNTPEQIGTATNWANISAGGYFISNYRYEFSIATQTNGSLWAWGANAQGQLGDGTNTKYQ